MLFRVGLGVPQEGDLLLAGSTPTLPRKKNGARVWGTKAKPLAAYRWRLCCLNSNLFVLAAPCRFHGPKCETADRAQTIRWFMDKRVRNVMAVTEVSAESRKT